MCRVCGGGRSRVCVCGCVSVWVGWGQTSDIERHGAATQRAAWPAMAGIAAPAPACWTLWCNPALTAQPKPEQPRRPHKGLRAAPGASCTCTTPASLPTVHKLGGMCP